MTAHITAERLLLALVCFAALLVAFQLRRETRPRFEIIGKRGQFDLMIDHISGRKYLADQRSVLVELKPGVQVGDAP